MSKFGKQSAIAVFILFVIVLASGLFVVQEGEKALVLVLGDLKESSGSVVVYEPGLHFKIPFITSARKFDARTQGFNSGSFSALTSKQTFLEVSYYVKWRISDVSLYYKRTSGSIVKAVSLMEPKINDIVRAQFGKHTSNEIISTERTSIMDQVRIQSKKQIESEYGIHIIDVRLQFVKLPARVLKSVFSRMASERKQFANNKRAEGLKAAESVRAKADQQVVVIQAQANKQAALIKAKGEEKAAKIYADAYSKNEKFYSLYRSLEAYRKSFGAGQDMLVLSPEGEFFNYFNNAELHKSKSE